MPNVYFDKDTVDTKPSEISICGTRAILPQTRLEMGAARPAPLELASTLKWLSWRECATFFILLCQVTECDSKKYTWSVLSHCAMGRSFSLPKFPCDVSYQSAWL
jgi:hypothetical protein